MTVLDDRKVDMSSLTITAGGKTERHEFDYGDPAQVKEMREKFDAAVSAGSSLGYATDSAGNTATLHKGEFPESKSQVVVQPQYAGG